MRLSHRDLESVTQSVGELYAVTDLESLPRAMIAILAKLVPSECISYNEIGPGTDRVVAILEPHLTNIEKLLPALGEHFHEHPVVEEARAHPARKRSAALAC